MMMMYQTETQIGIPTMMYGFLMVDNGLDCIPKMQYIKFSYIIECAYILLRHWFERIINSLQAQWLKPLKTTEIDIQQPYGNIKGSHLGVKKIRNEDVTLPDNERLSGSLILH